MSHSTWAVKLESRAELSAEMEVLKLRLQAAEAEARKWRRLHGAVSTTFAWAIGVFGLLFTIAVGVILWLHGRCI